MPGTARISLLVGAAAAMAWFSAAADPLPPSATYRPLPTLPLSAVKANDEAEKPQVMRDQQSVLD
ncbi:MAG: cytochrome B6, partial [Alphaproteobacteria bacterium]|nr:cytochrome B6 [Alphaproteobacteria bacterium]